MFSKTIDDLTNEINKINIKVMEIKKKVPYHIKVLDEVY
jgi:hypothetical protein